MPVIAQRPEVSVQSILLATDFSDSAMRATAYAASLARHYGSRLRVENVINLAIPIPATEGPVMFPIDEMREFSRKRMGDIVAHISGVKVDTEIVEAFSPSQALVTAAADSKMDLIVMGTAAKHGLKRIALGSIAEDVIRHASCPVMTVGPAVPPLQQDVTFRNVVYASDFSVEAAHAGKFAVLLSADEGAHLHLCHVITGVRESAITIEQGHAFTSHLMQLIPTATKDWFTAECVIETGKAPQAILDVADRVHADLIILGARKATFWASFFETDIAPQVLSRAHCPVLTVH